MKTHFLFPNKFKKLGWILFIPSLLLGSILFISGIDFGNYFKMNVFAIYSDQFLSGTNFFTIIENGVLDEIILVLIIVGAILISFSKTKNEFHFLIKTKTRNVFLFTRKKGLAICYIFSSS